MLSSSATLFTTLPARPPTPPKDVQEHVKSALDFLENGYDEADKDAPDATRQPASTDTPPVSSPVSSQGVTTGPNATKKVGFSPFPPIFHEVPKAGVSSSPRDRLFRSTPRPPSNKFVKSILKLSNFAPPPTPDEQEQRIGYFSPDDPASFEKMLQSVLNELGSSSRSQRLDAYLALQGALAAFEGIPDRQAMADNMPAFQKFFARDLVLRDSGGLTDTQIATQALKLACTMVFDTQLSKAMDDEFRMFLVDRSITVMEQPDMPKVLIKNHLYLVAQQRFHHNIITTARADRIIMTLRTIDERCTSNSLIATRLVIYQRLLDQAPAVMSGRLKEWLEHVFHGMLSSINDTRMRAIEVGNHAGLMLGTNPAASKALHDLFETEVDEGQCYCDYFALRLTSMIADKDNQTGACVPAIWSAVVLFFRSKRRPIERWPRLRAWLQVLQKCLNSSDSAIKTQANLAWKKLVFAVMPDTTTGDTMRSMLKVPITAGFEKRNSDKTGKQARQFALDGYHNLLHYGMRPSLSHEDLDVTWAEYVKPILSEMIRASHKGRVNACKILSGLLSPNAGVWNELAALEATAIKSDDLPRLDPRWVRSRLGKILALVEPIISEGLKASGEEGCLTAGLWQQTLQSIAEAGAQEVLTSNELREAIALVMNMSQRLWVSFCASNASNAATASNSLQDLMRTTCHYIGPSLLAEDILAKTPQGDAEAAPTPSHRPSKHQHALYSPLIFILSIMCTHVLPTEAPQEPSMAIEIIKLASKSKTTSAAKLQLLNRTLQVLRSNCPSDENRSQVSGLWATFSQGATEALQHSKTESTSTGTLGQKLRDALSIVIYGLPIMHCYLESSTAGKALIEEIASVARSQAGDGGVVLALSEPLAKACLDKDSGIDISTQTDVLAIILKSAGWPQNRQAMEQARKGLWAVGSGPHKAGTFDPHEHLYSLVKDTFIEGYAHASPDLLSAPESSATLSTLKGFIASCPSTLLVNALRQTQDGMTVWLEDAERKLFSSGESVLTQVVVALWGQILDQLTELPRKDSALLSSLQPLLIAGFVSPRRSIVNRTIVFWNESFGEQDTLRYPQQLEKVLRAVKPHVELGLPDFPNSAGNEESVELPAFSGQNDQDTQVEVEATSNNRWMGFFRGTASPIKRTPASHDVSSHLATIDTSGTNSGSKVSSRSTRSKARLRHDDSQVLFAPIESSPLPAEAESQKLTEHQQEVRARQDEDPQMFPDLSSTPVRKSTPHMNRKAPGTLDFSAQGADLASDGVAATPQDITEAHGEMSGYMGSSPTPRSSDKSRVVHTQFETAEDRVLEEEPSSSPPPQSPAQERDQPDNLDVEDDFIANSVPSKVAAPKVDAEPKEQYTVLRDSDLPSDTVLPAEQLQHEAEVAGDQAAGFDASSDEIVDVDATTVVDQTEVIPEQAASDDEARASGDDASRVENSFFEQAASGDSAVEPSPSGSQYSTRSAAKRRRVSGGADSATSKKQKRQSPFRRITSGLSGIFGRSQEDDDDMNDEIVVASSQPNFSPAATRSATRAQVASQDTQNPTASSQPTKRSRGRPRKSETPTPAPAPAQAPGNAPPSSMRLKRKASNLSTADDVSSEPTASATKEKSSTKRQRRRTKAKEAIAEASRSQEDTDSRPPSRREATAVLIESTDMEGDISQTRLASDDEGANGEDSSDKIEEKHEATTPPPQDLPKHTPKSIMSRLKDLFSDCKDMVFGSQEEREFDDVMFELRQEVHGNARKARSS